MKSSNGTGLTVPRLFPINRRSDYSTGVDQNNINYTLDEPNRHGIKKGLSSMVPETPVADRPRLRLIRSVHSTPRQPMPNIKMYYRATISSTILPPPTRTILPMSGPVRCTWKTTAVHIPARPGLKRTTVLAKLPPRKRRNSPVWPPGSAQPVILKQISTMPGKRSCKISSMMFFPVRELMINVQEAWDDRPNRLGHPESVLNSAMAGHRLQGRYQCVPEVCRSLYSTRCPLAGNNRFKPM